MRQPDLCLASAFTTAMDRLGPFEPHPALAVAVSGGADSMALAILARDWTHQRGGSVSALVVDHGLRPASAQEARITVDRLTQLGIAARLLPLVDLTHGPALAERARIRRYEVLNDACRQAGILHLLLGHHAADQMETLAMRVLRGSQTHGLAGMSALRETAGLRLLRPLLATEPGQLRRFLTARGVAWIEDPSNQDLRALRPRLRHRLAANAPGDTGLPYALAAVARLRVREEAAIGAELAQRATIRPEGFALLSPGRISSGALGRLIQTIGGARYAPSPAQLNEVAARPGPATLAGVRMMPAGRVGDGLLIVREEAAVMAPIKATAGSTWDNRFRVSGNCPEGATVGKLGGDAARFRGGSPLPSAVLRTLPAIRIGGYLSEIPHLSYAASGDENLITMLFSPPSPAAGAHFASVGSMFEG
jgi:tRNA(Ile)-lysidine synthase